MGTAAARSRLVPERHRAALPTWVGGTPLPALPPSLRTCMCVCAPIARLSVSPGASRSSRVKLPQKRPEGRNRVSHVEAAGNCVRGEGPIAAAGQPGMTRHNYRPPALPLG
jgi:hypothetical protein